MKRVTRVTGFVVLMLMGSGRAWAAETTIWFVNDYANPGKCLASTVTKKQRAARNEKIKWNLRNDLHNKCKGFDPTKAYLLFDTDIVGSNHKIPGTGNASNGRADATTANDPVKFPDGLYHYKVYYDDTLAEDPELDIKGDMQLPPPAKGRGKSAAPAVKK